jgi:hypothetical protein
VEIPYIKNIGTNHTPVKKGGEIEKKGKKIPVSKGFSADHIGGHGNKKKPRQGTGGGNENRNPIGPYYADRVFENHLIGFGGKFPGYY